MGAPPVRLGRYQIEKEIGRGMMGVVYRAHDPELGRTVALKTVAVSGVLHPEQREAFERRFLVEARAAAALSHPAIVVVHDVGRDPETQTPYIALEYLDGRTLASLLETNGRLPVPEALRIAAALADGLGHAHARGVVHRDVKPGNIMILPPSDARATPSGGAVKLMDFGIAKLPASQLTAAGDFFGTPSYMSPEQALNQPLDGRSDLFSLGCVLYAMLTGERAFQAESVPLILTRIVQENPPPSSSRRAELSPHVDAVVGGLLAKDRDDRYPDGRTAAEDLDDLAHGRTPRHRPAAGGPVARDRIAEPTVDLHTPPVVRRAPRVRAAIVALAVLAILAGGVGLVRLIPWGASSLELNLSHSLKTGTLRVFVDDHLALEEPLDSRVVQKVLGVEFRKGTLRKTLAVAPGEHVIHIQVQSGTFNASRRITGAFTRAGTRHLQVDVGGLLKRDISLVWSD